MDTKTRHDLLKKATCETIQNQLAVVRACGGESWLDEVLAELGLHRVDRFEGADPSEIRLRNHLEGAQKIVEHYGMASECANGTSDSVEAAVCLRRRIRDALACLATLEALRTKQGR